jgi:hypothetical protein
MIDFFFVDGDYGLIRVTIGETSFGRFFIGGDS